MASSPLYPSSFLQGTGALLAAPLPRGERDGSKADDSFPFEDRDDKQKEAIIEIGKLSDVVQEKAAQHSQTPLERCFAGGIVMHLVSKIMRLVQLERLVKEELLSGVMDLRSQSEQLERLVLPKRIRTRVMGLRSQLEQLERLVQEGLSERNHHPALHSPFKSLLTGALLAAPPPGRERDRSKADDSFPFDGRDEKQTEGILQNIKDGDALSQKAARNDQTPLAQKADDQEGSKRTSADMDAGATLHAAEDMGNNHHLILDSGAAVHATGNLTLLSGFTRAPEGSAAVYHTRDGRHLRVAGAGTIACDKFHLPRVHYVPDLGSTFTLVSVQQLTGCDYHVMFGGGWGYVKNGRNGSLVGKGRMHDEDGLYHLEFLSIPLTAADGAN